MPARQTPPVGSPRSLDSIPSPRKALSRGATASDVGAGSVIQGAGVRGGCQEQEWKPENQVGAMQDARSRQVRTQRKWGL